MKPIVVVAVIRVVVVAIGRAGVPRIIVEGTAAGCDQSPSTDSLLNTNSGKIKLLKQFLKTRPASRERIKD